MEYLGIASNDYKSIFLQKSGILLTRHLLINASAARHRSHALSLNKHIPATVVAVSTSFFVSSFPDAELHCPLCEKRCNLDIA